MSLDKSNSPQVGKERRIQARNRVKLPTSDSSGKSENSYMKGLEAGIGQSVAIDRPGISSATLNLAKVRWNDGPEKGSIVIPYFDMYGNPTGYVRWRLPKERQDGQKYHQNRGTGVSVYFPPGFCRLGPGDDLVIVEGEFKALALSEFGVKVIGLPSFITYGKGKNGTKELVSEITEAIEFIRPNRVLFLGDSDTATNVGFSRNAVVLAQKIHPIPVVLPRIPNSEPKGIDDVRHKYGAAFDDWWLKMVEDAEPLPKKTTMGQLAVRLLEREFDQIHASVGPEREYAERRVITMAAELAKEPAAQGKVEAIAKVLIGVPIAQVRAAIKQEAAQGARSKLGLDSIKSGSQASVETKIVFFEGGYYRKTADDFYQRICREDAKLEIRMMGVSDRIPTGDTKSPLDDVLYDIQMRNSVEYAAPLCGRKAGIYRDNGHTVLATNSPRYPNPELGDPAPLNTFFSNLFGFGKDDMGKQQYFVFLSWLKHALEAFGNPDQRIPGQLLCIVGPSDCGKTLCQTLITKILGGRAADPVLWLTGKSNFNDNLWGAEHLAMSDANFPERAGALKEFRDRVKEIIACDIYTCHRKHRAELSLRPVWRITLTANDDIDSAYVLPGLDESMRDKVIYLRAYSPPIPFAENSSIEERGEFFRGLIGAIPAFVHQLKEFEIPQELRKGRFGVKEFHHPKIVELINSLTPEGDLAVYLEQWLEDKNFKEQQLAAVELFDDLCDFTNGKIRSITKSPTHLGHQLGRLSTAPGWEERISKSYEKFGPSRTRRTVWTIRSLGEVGDIKYGVQSKKNNNTH